MNDNLRERLKVNLSTEILVEAEKRRIYQKMVQDEMEAFILFMDLLNQYINKLKEEGKVSQLLEFQARIKATNSALMNDGVKALDDIFGIGLICTNESELQFMRQELDKVLRIHKQRIHNKENGYVAVHHICTLKEEVITKLNEFAKRQGKKERKAESFPIIEIQYKTREVEYEATYGTASHEQYKDSQISELQTLYEKNKICLGEDVPFMWVSDNGKMRMLSIEEILQKMYPSLKLERKEEYLK